MNDENRGGWGATWFPLPPVAAEAVNNATLFDSEEGSIG